MIFELAHQIGLLPILGMLIVGRQLPRAYWLVALAIFVSWFADSVTHFSGGTWEAWYLFLPIQIWLILVAFKESHRIALGLALLILTVVSWNLTHPGPEQLVTILGSIAILSVVRAPFIWPLGVYFGAGTVARLFMVSQVGADIFPAWCVYQACRALGIILFIWIIAPPLVHRREGRQCG